MTDRGNIGGRIQEVRTNVDREFMFYDMLPAEIRRVAMNAPYEFSMEAVYNDYIAWQHANPWTEPHKYVPRMERTFVNTMYKNSPYECCGNGTYKLEKRYVPRKSVQNFQTGHERPRTAFQHLREFFGY